MFKLQSKEIKSSDEIFRYIKPNDNDKISEMKGFDLQDLLLYLDEYYLTLREEIGLSKEVTIGLELELEYVMEKRIKASLWDSGLNHKWKHTHDTTLINGMEIDSPILTDSKRSWEELKTICSIVTPYSQIGTCSGGHIHIGAQVLGDNIDSWVNFAGLWSAYENIIFRFCYGDYLTGRSSILDFAAPIAEDARISYEDLKKISELSFDAVLREFRSSKYKAVNFNHVRSNNRFAIGNTIEFRCPNGSVDPVIWQNNVNLFAKLLRYCKSDNFDEDIINRRWAELSSQEIDIDLYDEIFLPQALELCDLIFDNNLDKVYFLRQYLKSFQTIGKRISIFKPYTLTNKSKPFTMKKS